MSKYQLNPADGNLHEATFSVSVDLGLDHNNMPRLGKSATGDQPSAKTKDGGDRKLAGGVTEETLPTANVSNTPNQIVLVPAEQAANNLRNIEKAWGGTGNVIQEFARVLAERIEKKGGQVSRRDVRKEFEALKASEEGLDFFKNFVAATPYENEHPSKKIGYYLQGCDTDMLDLAMSDSASHFRNNTEEALSALRKQIGINS